MACRSGRAADACLPSQQTVGFKQETALQKGLKHRRVDSTTTAFPNTTKKSSIRRQRCGLAARAAEDHHRAREKHCEEFGGPPRVLVMRHSWIARSTFDEVAALSVEGLNKSAIARVKQIAWNTVARWLEKAAHSCRRFNDRKVIALSRAVLAIARKRTFLNGRRTGDSPWRQR